MDLVIQGYRLKERVPEVQSVQRLGETQFFVLRVKLQAGPGRPGAGAATSSFVSVLMGMLQRGRGFRAASRTSRALTSEISGALGIGPEKIRSIPGHWQCSCHCLARGLSRPC